MRCVSFTTLWPRKGSRWYSWRRRVAYLDSIVPSCLPVSPSKGKEVTVARFVYVVPKDDEGSAEECWKMVKRKKYTAVSKQKWIGGVSCGRAKAAGPMVAVCSALTKEVVTADGIDVAAFLSNNRIKHGVGVLWPSEMAKLSSRDSTARKTVQVRAVKSLLTLLSKEDQDNVGLVIEGPAQVVKSKPNDLFCGLPCTMTAKGHPDPADVVSMAKALRKHIRKGIMDSLAFRYPQYRFGDNQGTLTLEHQAAIAIYGLIDGVHNPHHEDFDPKKMVTRAPKAHHHRRRGRENSASRMLDIPDDWVQPEVPYIPNKDSRVKQRVTEEPLRELQQDEVHHRPPLLQRLDAIIEEALPEEEPQHVLHQKGSGSVNALSMQIINATTAVLNRRGKKKRRKK